ncbi:FAD-dependent oxidoreductase [Rathayibacter sp. CAU 1779]
MITVDELRGIPVFEPLPAEPLEYLVRAVEDIRLLPGEYFAHEGDERAFFVVVEGGAEITKLVNGDEIVIGTRKPGQFFGEVPMTLSTPFPASGRAAGTTRIIKLDPTAFYTLGGMAPSIPAKVAALARSYLDDLQHWASEQPDIEVHVYGPRQDAATHDVAGFLTRNQVAFDLVSVEPEPGRRYPVVELAGGRRIEAPSARDLAGAVGLDVQPARGAYDLVVLGAGPSGLTAAVNGAAEGLASVVIEALAPGGQAGTSTRIENYTGFPFGISGDDLASRALKQAKRLGAEIVVTRSVVDVRPDRHEVMLDGGDLLRARVIVLATGVQWRTLPLASVGRYLGTGVYYGAARSDSGLAQGADVCIVGAGNSAGQAAIFFSRYARSVTILVRGDSLEASMSRYLIDQIVANDGIRVRTRSEIVGLHGDSALESVDVVDKRDGSTTSDPFSVVFVMIGADAVTGWLPAEIARDDHGFIRTGADAADTPQWTADRRPFALETSAPGVFAVGDVRSGSVKRVAAGVGEGGMAVAFAHQYLALGGQEGQSDPG